VSAGGWIDSGEGGTGGNAHEFRRWAKIGRPCGEWPSGRRSGSAHGRQGGRGEPHEVLRQRKKGRGGIIRKQSDLVETLAKELFEAVLEVPYSRQSQLEAKRLSGLMVQLGFQHRKSLRFGQQVLTGYVIGDDLTQA
jgi:hypothetical protein